MADCPPAKEDILDLAARYGLLDASITLRPEPGKPVPASALTPEPVDLWRREIRELRAVGDLWDRIAAGLACAPFHLVAIRENGSGFRMRYRPATLRTAIWQRVAREVAGLKSGNQLLQALAAAYAECI